MVSSHISRKADTKCIGNKGSFVENITYWERDCADSLGTNFWAYCMIDYHNNKFGEWILWYFVTPPPAPVFLRKNVGLIHIF